MAIGMCREGGAGGGDMREWNGMNAPYIYLCVSNVCMCVCVYVRIVSIYLFVRCMRGRRCSGFPYVRKPVKRCCVLCVSGIYTYLHAICMTTFLFLIYTARSLILLHLTCEIHRPFGRYVCLFLCASLSGLPMWFVVISFLER